MAATFPPIGQVLSLTGSAIANAYSSATPSTTASAALQVGRAARVRFYGTCTLAGGSAVTTLSVKLQTRYTDPSGSPQTTYTGLPSTLDDVQGAAQPKGGTYELEHSVTVSAGATTDFTFYLNSPGSLSDIRVDVHAQAAGSTTDNVTVYAVAG